jgi:hypothetical protein
MQGLFRVGFSINGKTEFLPQIYSHNVIGGYGATFNKRAIFIYKTQTLCNGYFIRKSNWLKIIYDQSLSEIVILMKMNLEHNYHTMVKKNGLEYKNERLR